MTVVNETNERVVLVDEDDREKGAGPKLGVHRDGTLHRAFSIFVFDAAGRTLVQRRANQKYHSGGLWANTCCGHPRPGESIGSAAVRRLEEELGFRTPLTSSFHARYRADLDRGMIENEYVHVFFGQSAKLPRPEVTEVQDFAYLGLEDLRDGTGIPRSQQTIWLRHYLDMHFPELLEMRERSGLATLSSVSSDNRSSERDKNTWPARFQG